MGKILTVVIPSYNVERFLPRTLESFVDERIMKDIEVLVVDDGSQDGTAAVGKMFEEKYPDTFRVISKENGGHGSTINRGIEECTGTYFKVVDGDDWVNTSDFAELTEKLKTCDADFVVTNYYEVHDKTGEKKKKAFPMLLNREDGISGSWKFTEMADKVQLPMHALVIRSSILKENNIRLDENCFYVDVEYILYPIPFVETVEYYDLAVYMYRLAQGTQSVSMQGYRKHIDNHIDVIMHLTEFAEKYRKEAGSKGQKKAGYIGKRIAQMIGDQISIFMSYPVSSKRTKERFLTFDRKLKEKSLWIYRLSGEESGTLKLLRTTRFLGYRPIMRRGQKRNTVTVQP